MNWLFKKSRRPGKRHLPFVERCAFCGRIVRPMRFEIIAFLGFVRFDCCKNCIKKMRGTNRLLFYRFCGILFSTCFFALVIFAMIRFEKHICIWGPLFVLFLMIGRFGFSEFNHHYRVNRESSGNNKRQHRSRIATTRQSGSDGWVDRCDMDSQ
jgi:hypothetical protein